MEGRNAAQCVITVVLLDFTSISLGNVLLSGSFNYDVGPQGGETVWRQPDVESNQGADPCHHALLCHYHLPTRNATTPSEPSQPNSNVRLFPCTCVSMSPAPSLSMRASCDTCLHRCCRLCVCHQDQTRTVLTHFLPPTDGLNDRWSPGKPPCPCTSTRYQCCGLDS